MVGFFHEKSHLEMDDDCGYPPLFRKPPSMMMQYITYDSSHPQIDGQVNPY